MAAYRPKKLYVDDHGSSPATMATFATRDLEGRWWTSDPRVLAAWEAGLALSLRSEPDPAVLPFEKAAEFLSAFSYSSQNVYRSPLEGFCLWYKNRPEDRDGLQSDQYVARYLQGSTLADTTLATHRSVLNRFVRFAEL